LIYKQKEMIHIFINKYEQNWMSKTLIDLCDPGFCDSYVREKLYAMK